MPRPPRRIAAMGAFDAPVCRLARGLAGGLAVPVAVVFALSACGVASAQGSALIGVDGRPITLATVSAAAIASSSAQTDARASGAMTTSTEVHRIDVANPQGGALPGYRSDASAVAVQRWTERGGAGVGVGVGSITLAERPAGMTAGRFSDSGALPRATTGGLVEFGMRYRPTVDSSVYASATHVSGLGLASDDRVVSKVGVEFKAAQSNFKIDYGGLGMHFSSDTRMTVKLRRGGVAIGMRRTF